MANVVNKYFAKKKKQIYDYCKLISKMLIYENNQIWQTQSEMNELLKESISVYINKHYFKPLNNFEGYEAYFKPLIRCDDKFKTILVCNIENIPDEIKNSRALPSIYVLSLLIYTSVILNEFTHPYNDYKVNTKNVKNVITSMFASVSFAKYEENSSVIREIVSLLKKNQNLEKRIFESFDSLNSDISGNVFEPIDSKFEFYKIIYKYDIPELEEYRARDVKKYLKKIADDLGCISYELSTISALKAKMLSKDINLLFPIDAAVYTKESEINKLLKIVSCQEIRKSIKFYLNYEDFKKNNEIIRAINSSGIEMVYDMKGDAEVPYAAFNTIKAALIDSLFLEKNKRNSELWENDGVKFIERKRNESVSEFVMLGLEEEK